MSHLEANELLRYQRHFPVIGISGQQQLKQAKVLCIGAGGLGCPALQYLAAAGIGTLGVMDEDTIEISNLQRQILFNEHDIGRNKAIVVSERLHTLNSHISIDVYSKFLSVNNANKIIANYDVILDATDNFKTRYLLNDVCRTLNKPLISASIYQFDAQLSVFNYKNGPCYQCLYPEPPPPTLSPNCTAGGVLGVLPGLIGTLQATETIKVILEMGEILSGTLLTMDLRSMSFNKFEIPKQNCNCHIPVIFNKSEQVYEDMSFHNINALDLSKLIIEPEHKIQLIDVREPYEHAMCNIGGINIPLSSLENNCDKFDKNRKTIIYCKSGARGASACKLLQNFGFKNLKNLKGGILSWIDTVDNSLLRY
ncbi:MAG: HesA/MoeB/ThiF family protein [Legionellaceae bacterium]|nr:HesA/MoeB/ThiF family protein [Legionellaceae bacterium]